MVSALSRHSLLSPSSLETDVGERIEQIALNHACASHPLFSYLSETFLTRAQITALLRNYDAHAAVLRRLLLKAATLMPEAAVGYILENVRSEYGSGQPEQAHSLQLKDLAYKAGSSESGFSAVRIAYGVRRFIIEATKFYYPSATISGMPKSAIAAGAITATEILALKEFKAMQIAFAKHGLSNHVWFDHVTVEANHTNESIQLAIYFIEKHNANIPVLHGLNGVLNATVLLYDGLLESMLGA